MHHVSHREHKEAEGNQLPTPFRVRSNFLGEVSWDVHNSQGFRDVSQILPTIAFRCFHKLQIGLLKFVGGILTLKFGAGTA